MIHQLTDEAKWRILTPAEPTSVGSFNLSG